MTAGSSSTRRRSAAVCGRCAGITNRLLIGSAFFPIASIDCSACSATIGSLGSANPPSEYLRVPLKGMLAPGSYLVVGAAGIMVPMGALKIDFIGATNNIQNGNPDGIALIDTVAGELVH